MDSRRFWIRLELDRGVQGWASTVQLRRGRVLQSFFDHSGDSFAVKGNAVCIYIGERNWAKILESILPWLVMSVSWMLDGWTGEKTRQSFSNFEWIHPFQIKSSNVGKEKILKLKNIPRKLFINFHSQMLMLRHSDKGAEGALFDVISGAKFLIENRKSSITVA